MAIFLDTCFYVALLNPKDKYYIRSKELLISIQNGKFGRVYSSIYVMAEAATLLGIRTRKNQTIVEGAKNLFMGDTQIAVLFRSTEIIENKAWNLYMKVNDNPKTDIISYVDCTNIIFCQEREIEHILSFDAHFEVWLSRIT